MLIAGVDGCRGGWLVSEAEITPSGLRLTGVNVYRHFATVLEVTAECAAVAVDMPIGLSSDGVREADSLARQLIGPRRSSVFPPPARAVLAAVDYTDACAISAATHRFGRKLPKQTFFLFDKIREIDEAMSPALQRRVFEAHPEVCFWALNGQRHLGFAKRRPEGELERRSLLESLFGSEAIAARVLPRGAARDDLWDACVLLWTAARLARDCAQHLPSAPVYDAKGLRMEIAY